MTAPPLFAAAALLFWGNQVGLFLPAAVIALALEVSRLVSWRWSLSRENQCRLSDICAAAFGITAAVLYFSMEPLRAILLMVQWVPLFLFPVALAQAYSAEKRLDAAAFFWTLRHRGGSRRVYADISYIYPALCVLCASDANIRTGEYYTATVLLGAWALWSARPRSFPVPAWLPLLVLAAWLGYEGHVQLRALQGALERGASGLVYGVLAGAKDPFQSRTAIGSIGELKRFDNIVLRVRPEGRFPPALLRNASYDVCKGNAWFARDADFRDIPAGSGSGEWLLSAGSAAKRVAIAQAFFRGAGLLSLPGGAAVIEGLPAGAVKANRLGAVKAEDGPGLASYSVRFSGGASLEDAPAPADLAVPPERLKMFSELAGRLGLFSKKPEEKAAAVARYFSSGFSYSLSRPGGRPLSDPLGDFLTRTRSGHCEYFATATVLLLRAAGVPARYATGFSVQEFSRLERAYIVRQRHSHAWTRFFVGGAWTDLDTTPPSWLEAETPPGGLLGPLKDFGSWLKFTALRALWGGGLKDAVGWLLLPAGLWLAWKFRGGLGKLAFRRGPLKVAGAPAVPGADSELYRVEKKMRAKGLGRRPWETFSSWAGRTGPVLGAGSAARLSSLARLHERYRFDPAGLPADDREDLRAGSGALLDLPGDPPRKN